MSAALSASMSGMSMQAATPTAQAPAISSFNKEVAELHGFLTSHSTNLKHNLKKKEKARDSTYAFEKFSTAAKPAVRPGDRHIAIGTDDPEATQHFLSIVDAEIALNDIAKDPVVCHLPVSDHMSDVKWLNASTLLAATGKGNLKLFEFHQQNKALKHIGDMKSASSSYIREIAINPQAANQVSIGGFDNILSILDLNRPDSPYVQRLDMQSVIGSVKWSPFNQSTYISCCLDEGKFFMFDTRQPINQSAFFSDLRKEDLFTHERYNDYNLLLGFGDGQFKHVDMRQPKAPLHSVQDPYVEAIGGIEYNAQANAFVLSGYSDFSVWKEHNGEMKIWSHSKNSDDILNPKGWACSAAWYDATTVVSSDSVGAVGLYLQDFD